MKKRLFNAALLALATISSAWAVGLAQDAENVGKRPYEMEWAGRTEEVRTPLVDFENLDGWRVETTNSVASFERSREEQMYGQYVGKLTYRCEDSAGAVPEVTIRPPQPIPMVEKEINACSCWIVGNNWGWTVDPTTPRVRVKLLFVDSSGKEYELPLETVNWKEWFLCYRIIPRELASLLETGGAFSGIRVVAGTNTEDRTLYFDSLCVFKEDRGALTFSQRPRPGIDLFEGQPLGVNTGEERLPFPTNEDTVIPDSSKNIKTPMFHFYGDWCDLVYTGSDGELVYEYHPQSGDWSDLSARWDRSEKFRPCVGGGVTQLVGDGGKVEPVKSAELLEFKQTDEGASARWKLVSETATAEVEYRFQIKGKSLVIDTLAKGGRVPEVAFGRVEDLGAARVFTIPYYLYDYGRRPGVGLLTTADSDPAKAVQLFAGAHVDWYRSGASYLRGANGVDGKAATLNGGAEYRVKTDGTRNDVYERFVITFSPEFDEVLPTIANPASPYRAVAGKGVWRSHGATTRERDKSYWSDVYRHGMRHMIVTDHEVCWRDGGESFTFRTKPAPEKGGDEGWFDYCRFMQDKLGFVYGPYNNFTDFSPVNEYWSPDMISRAADWSLQPAWMRCYAPKPTRAVEYCEKLTPINEEKFHFSCAYCDVHSSVPPWTRTDYDERVPGAGTFMSVYYPYGEIFLLQKKNWDGPTYSEGPHHCFYAGLVDGNYAQDQPYNMFMNPWLVDFDLRKMHDLEVDFGMGNLGMFAPGYSPKTPEEQSDFVDRFVAATLGFGHSGFFAADYGWRLAARSYFMTQQIASYYTQTSADTIRYYDADGEGYETSEALKRDLVKRSQLGVVYKDGTTVFANGSKTEPMTAKLDDRVVALPPNGYVAWTADGKVLVESFLSETGRRFDYCESPEYIWLDARGVWTERNRACGDGVGLCLTLDTPGEYEIVPYDDKEIGFKLAEHGEFVNAVALDKENNELGPATVKRARGFVFVAPVEGAFSYKVVVRPAETEIAEFKEWRASKRVVAPGDNVKLTNGIRSISFTAVKVGNVVDETPFVETTLGLEGLKWFCPTSDRAKHVWLQPFPDEFAEIFSANPGQVAFRSADDGTVFSRDISQDYDSTKPDAAVELPAPEKSGAETSTTKIGDDVYALTFDVKETYRRYPFDFESASAPVAVLLQRRGEAPTPFVDGTGAQKHFDTVACGGVAKKARRMHPPYIGGIGRTILEYQVAVPKEKSVMFRMDAGKGDGSDPGDGILYEIAVRRGDGEEKTLARQVVKDHVWVPVEADLTEFAGEDVTLIVAADVNEESSGDWACCADMRLESGETFLKRVLTGVALKAEK